MDLIDLMTTGADPELAAINRLKAILGQYDSADQAVQDEALSRAMTFCEAHWGSYSAGLEALASHIETAENDPLEVANRSLRLREEAESPGYLVRAARERREREASAAENGSSIIGRYGSREAVSLPTEQEQLFMTACRHLCDEEDGDPFGPLAGWSLPWHPLPDSLRDAVSLALPLPETLGRAREEFMVWEQRLSDLSAVYDGPGHATLPTACAARFRVVEELWSRVLPATSLSDVMARVEYWNRHGGDDGSGYAVMEGDLKRVLAGDSHRLSSGTGDEARRLRERHPDWSLARMGKELGISRQAVHKHLKKGHRAG